MSDHPGNGADYANYMRVLGPPLPQATVEAAFGRLSDGSKANAALDLLEDDLEKRQHEYDLVVFKMLESGQSPDHPTLLTTYAKKHAAWKLLLSLRAHAEKAKSAARTLAPILEGQHGGY